MERNGWYRLLVSCGAIAAAVLHVFVPTLVPDAITAGFLVLALIPWLAPLIKSVEIPGVGKVELQEVRHDALEAKGAALSAERKAEFAVADMADVTSSARVQVEPIPSLDALAEEYNRIRATQESGAPRTALMTTVVRRMIEACRSLPTLDVVSYLKSQDRGKRLAAYAWLYSRQRPDTGLLDALVDSIVNVEDKPFGQYWGLQAVSRMLGRTDRASLGAEAVNRLRRLLARLRPGTDRHYELSRILESIDAATGRRLTRDGADGAAD